MAAAEREKPLSPEEAERFASQFRPSWEADDDAPDHPAKRNSSATLADGSRATSPPADTVRTKAADSAQAAPSDTLVDAAPPDSTEEGPGAETHKSPGENGSSNAGARPASATKTRMGIGMDAGPVAPSTDAPETSASPTVESEKTVAPAEKAPSVEVVSAPPAEATTDKDAAEPAPVVVPDGGATADAFDKRRAFSRRRMEDGPLAGSPNGSEAKVSTIDDPVEIPVSGPSGATVMKIVAAVVGVIAIGLGLKFGLGGSEEPVAPAPTSAPSTIPAATTKATSSAAPTPTAKASASASAGATAQVSASATATAAPSATAVASSAPATTQSATTTSKPVQVAAPATAPKAVAAPPKTGGTGPKPASSIMKETPF